MSETTATQTQNPSERVARLSQDQVEAYRRDGFVIPNYRMPAQVLADMRCAYAQLLSDNPGISPDFMLSPHLEKRTAQGLRGSRQWLSFATQRDILDMLAQLVGPDLILWGTTLFGKPAHNGKATPWHQDGDYYPIRPLETITVWIALDDATVANGCMRFIPGSHRARKLYSHHREENPDLTINLVCDDQHFDECNAFDLELEAGQLSFHDVYMIHGSHANRTACRRAAFVIRIMPGHCHYDHALGQEMERAHSHHSYGSRPLFQIRGCDLSGKNNFSIGH